MLRLKWKFVKSLGASPSYSHLLPNNPHPSGVSLKGMRTGIQAISGNFELTRRNSKPLPLLLAVALAAPFTGFAAVDLDSNRVAQIAALLPANPGGLGRPARDRAAWERLAGVPEFAAQVEAAVAWAAKPDPELSDELFLDYSRTGNRDRCQRVMFQRGERLTSFTLAECLENQGRFLKPLTNTIAALCSEKTWVYPAHDGRLNNFYGRTVEMDLRATAVAWELATADFLLGDKLPPATRALIRENVHRRVLQPLRDMVAGRRAEISWLRVNNNWNAVCLAGVTGAALALEDTPKDRAEFIAAAEIYIRNFLKGFTPDGYCSEGLGYWNYGFGHFAMLGETVRQSTGGTVDLLADPTAWSPARYAARSEVLNGLYPTIADCSPGTKPDEKFVRYLDERFGVTTSGDRGATFLHPGRSLVSTVLFAFLPEKLPVAPGRDGGTDSPLRTWFSDGGVLICRTGPGARSPFAVALKGGHNAEHHNHNDVGSFSVVSGKAMVLCDPGAEVYTARTFSGKRYDSKVLNSFGHAVPVIAGKLQRTGKEAQAVVLRADFTDAADTLALDFKSAYAVPELQKLERTFVFKRGQTALSVQDEVEFASPQTFETALVTWGQWKRISEKELAITDDGSVLRVRIETGGLPVEVRAEVLDEDVRTKTKPTRIGIALVSPVRKAGVTLIVTPDTGVPSGSR